MAGTPAGSGSKTGRQRRPKDGDARRDKRKKVDARHAKKVGRPPGKQSRRRDRATRSRHETPRRRRKGSGTRAAQALSLVKGQPGITIPELATKMGIKQNYLYRVLPGLEQEGKIVKKGRGWHPKA